MNETERKKISRSSQHFIHQELYICHNLKYSVSVLHMRSAILPFLYLVVFTIVRFYISVSACELKWSMLSLVQSSLIMIMPSSLSPLTALFLVLLWQFLHHHFHFYIHRQFILKHILFTFNFISIFIFTYISIMVFTLEFISIFTFNYISIISFLWNIIFLLLILSPFSLALKSQSSVSL